MLRLKNLLLLSLALGLAACGSGGSGGPDTGTLTVGLTDATINEVEQVRIYIRGITVKSADGPAESYGIEMTNMTDCMSEPGETDDCNPIDLLSLQDGTVLTVVSGLELDAGFHEWIRLDVDPTRSYVVEPGGGVNTDIEIRVPSNRGLQLSGGFHILQGEETYIVMDWDAYKGMTNPIGRENEYILKPSIRITDMSEFGTITGVVIDQCPGGAPEDYGVVYVFAGDVTPDDIDNNDPNPLVTAQVEQRNDGSFGYSVHFLPLSTYTVAHTCDDDPVPSSDTDLDEANDDITFSDPQVVEIVADGQEVDVSF